MRVQFSVRPSILLNRRECSPLGVNKGVNIPPRGQISPLGARGEVKNGQTFNAMTTLILCAHVSAHFCTFLRLQLALLKDRVFFFYKVKENIFTNKRTRVLVVL
jgi:hypothetical protein